MACHTFNMPFMALNLRDPASVQAAVSNFSDYAGPLTETILLGNLAVWAATTAETSGKKIELDPVKPQAKNAPEVEHVIRPPVRDGWNA